MQLNKACDFLVHSNAIIFQSIKLDNFIKKLGCVCQTLLK